MADGAKEAATTPQVVGKTKPTVDVDSSLHSSSVAQPLIKNKSPSHLDSVGHAVSLQSPKVMASARHAVQREQTLQFGNQDEGRSVIQSQEGALLVMPRPRFKINEGGGDQVESIMSHFSQSEIN